MGSGPPPSPQTGRRAELADFLRSRRAAVRPETIGIDAGSRRRTPGLRREEVAARAAVGLSWYTWLEQGRAITPSAQVLEALSEPCCSAPPSASTSSSWRASRCRSPRSRWAARWTTTRPPCNLLDFRRAYAGREHEPAFAELVDDLTSSSAAFRSWWAGHDVNALEPALKEMRHPRFGILRLRQLQSRLEHRPELRLRVLVPDDDATRRKLVAATQTCGLSWSS